MMASSSSSVLFQSSNFRLEQITDWALCLTQQAYLFKSRAEQRKVKGSSIALVLAAVYLPNLYFYIIAGAHHMAISYQKFHSIAIKMPYTPHSLLFTAQAGNLEEQEVLFCSFPLVNKLQICHMDPVFMLLAKHFLLLCFEQTKAADAQNKRL